MNDLPILSHVDGRAGVLTLNRPSALHALNLEMCQRLTAALLEWRDDPRVDLIVITHRGERGFCAGGDLRMMAQSGRGDGSEARAFFQTEYRLNHLLHAYPKPVVALMDGVTMGGGVGISVHGSHRVATERTVFAMPETAIGFFPDVGGGWFLPRLEREVGTWLALTGTRIKGIDTLSVGVATHFVESAMLSNVLFRLTREGVHALDGLSTGGPRMPHHDGALVPYFRFDSIDEVLAALDADGGTWTTQQAATLRSRSRQALEISLRQLRRGRALTSLSQVLAMEFRLATRLVRSSDFQEGVRAVIVEKDNAPRWSIDRPDLDALFAPLREEWTPLTP